MEDNVSFFDNERTDTGENGTVNFSAGGMIEAVQMSFLGADVISWKDMFKGFNRMYAIIYSSGMGFACSLISMFDYAEVIFGSDEVMTYSMQEIMAYQEKTVERLCETSSKSKRIL